MTDNGAVPACQENRIVIRRIAASLVVVALAVVAAPAPEREPALAHTGETGVHFALDCDIYTPGVQSSCDFPIGTRGVDVGITVAKENAGDETLGAFNFAVQSEQTKFNPTDPDTYFAGNHDLNGNPDFSNDGWTPTLAGTWDCDPPGTEHDTDPSATVANSTIACDNSHATAPALAGDGTHVTVAVVHYDVAMPLYGSGSFTFGGYVENIGGSELGSCNQPGTVVVNCYGATISIVEPQLGAGFNLAIDCDVITPGWQNVCSYPLGTTTIDVAYVVMTFFYPGQLASFGSEIRTDQTMLTASSGIDNNLNGNPDFNNALNGVMTDPWYNGWSCMPPGAYPDADPSPQVTWSYLYCFQPYGVGPPLRANTVPMVLATTRYGVVAASPGSAALEIGGDLYDVGFEDSQTCYSGPPFGARPLPEPPPTPPGAGCFSAMIVIGGSLFDTDGDTRNDVVDNCVAMANTSQLNDDANFIDMSPPKMYDDVTRANSDKYGDACDHDDDNDGILDQFETTIPCTWASTTTDPLSEDTDGDYVLDGAECLLASDPASAASLPPPSLDSDNDLLSNNAEFVLGTDAGDVDSDDDLIIDGIEVLRLNTNPLAANTDGDACSDAKEIASINGDQTVSSLDLSQVAQSFSNSTAPPYLLNMDVNKDQKVNSTDLQRVAIAFGAC